MKRLLSCQASEILAMNGKELKQAILASEGRTVLTEMTVFNGCLLGNITNAEVASAFGSDMILLNGLDCFDPVIPGLPETDEPIKLLRELCGRPVGANLEPVDDSISLMSEKIEIVPGRKATAETFKAAEELGLQFICLTGNPGTGVTNKMIAKAIKECKKLGIHTLATAIYTADQAFLAAMNGAEYLAPYVNRMDNYGDGVGNVKDLIEMLRVNHMDSKVVAASFKNTHQVHELIKAGIQAVTVPCDVVFNMIDHPGTKIAVGEFCMNWQKAYHRQDLFE